MNFSFARIGGFIILLGAGFGLSAQEPCFTPPPCEPGYRVVEEICYKEVCRKCCKVVPDVKKTSKPCFDVKEEDYCRRRCPCCLSCGNFFGCKDVSCCPKCGKPCVRRRLLKKTVSEECPTWKCVVDTVVDYVPVKTYRKVPCCTTAPCVSEEIPPKAP